jgi:MoxR-like ATPase
VADGLLRAEHFPFVVMTSNADRDFPAPFLRRCIRLDIAEPDRSQLTNIVQSQLARFKRAMGPTEVEKVIDAFLKARAGGDVSTDQLLNAVFLTVALRNGNARKFDERELDALQEALLRPIGP